MDTILAGFVDRVRGWTPRAPHDGSAPLGFNLEGPFIAAERKGAQNPAHIRVPAEVDLATRAEGEALVREVRRRQSLQQLSRARPHHSEHGEGAGDIGHGHALSCRDMTLDPVLVAHDGCTAGG